MTWHDTDLTAALPRYLIGFDRPQLFWGTVIEPGASPVERSVVLRMSFSSVPESQVQRVNDRVQYASNVVNLVIPDFEDSRVANGLSEFNLVAASRLFYQYFPDQYESIAFVPKSSVLSDFSAFHTNVKNAVTGLGMTTFDSTALFGSVGTLQGIELFGAGYALVNASSTHEFAHQWGDDFDWAKIASISTSGHQPTAHSPLWWPAKR